MLCIAVATSLELANADAQSVTFDFDAAPLRSPLPLDVVQGTVVAHFAGTGQSYSIQQAGVMGFTPSGFSGNAIYPSGVYAADLLVSFNTKLSAFSIMYAPEEYACDSSATLRVTAYDGTTVVGSATTTCPVPGTWPTGTLAITPAQPFDNVVVHYDASPPTGGDWGPIFMADNMIVTVADAVFANGFE